MPPVKSGKRLIQVGEIIPAGAEMLHRGSWIPVPTGSACGVGTEYGTGLKVMRCDEGIPVVKTIAASLEKTSTNVRKYLDVSTSHITDADRIFLEGKLGDHIELPACGYGFRAISHEYGWFVSVPKLEDLELSSENFRAAVVKVGLSEAFADLIIHAETLGCLWINLDQAADTEDGLPTFEW